jgi:MFS family permease
MCLAGAIATALIRGSDVDSTRARGGEVVEPGALPPRARTTHVAGVWQLVADRRMMAFAASVVLFHFANAAMLPLVGQKLAAGSGVDSGAAGAMASAIIAAQLVMIPVALAASRLAETWGRKPLFLVGFLVLPVRGVLYTLSANASYLVAVQLLDGIGAVIFGVVGVLVIADLTHGTGRFSFMQGALATATGLGAALSNVVTGAVVQSAGFDAGFLVLAMIAAVALSYFVFAVPETRPSPKAIFPATPAASFSTS